MTIQTASIATTRKHRRTRFITAAAGAVLALTAAGGIGAWQITRSSGSQEPAAAAPVPSVSGDTPALSRAATSTPARETLYIVATDAEAAQLWDAIAVTVPDPSRYQVMVLDPASDSGVAPGLGEQNDLRHANGLGQPVKFIDLRTPQASTAAAAPVVRDGDPYPREILTVYLVGTEEQEAFVQGRLSDANLLRHRTGQPAVRDVVFLIRSAEEEARAAEWVALVRGQQESLRLPGVFVVDMR